MASPWASHADEILNLQQSDIDSGLSAAVVESRLAVYGKNALIPAEKVMKCLSVVIFV